MSTTVLVVAEVSGESLHRLSSEALSAARQLSEGRVVIVLPGHATGRFEEELRSMAPHEVLLIDDPLLEQYTPDGYTTALTRVIEDMHPDIVLFPNTYQARDYAPKLAARFRHSLVNDCIAIESGGVNPVLVRSVFQGRANAKVELTGPGPHFVSIQSGAFDTIGSGTSEETVTRTFDVALSSEQIRTRPEEIIREVRSAVDLDKADVIVAVGRGIKSAEQVEQATRMAELLGGELAASRPLCDEGMVPMERQIGSSGVTVTPKVYLALGISGAIQHVIGMKGSATIIAINKDASAPIFKIADIAVVGDLAELLPVLVSTLEDRPS